MALNDIETIIVVILENRSFDHAVGYLSLATTDPPMQVEGLRSDPAWLDGCANDDGTGNFIRPQPLDATTQRIDDPPHDLTDIERQINTPTHAATFSKMGGFITSYAHAIPKPTNLSRVMGYYRADAVPIFDFFARNFAVCDHWFSSLPTGTQANRLMAMGGESKIYDNVSDPFHFPNQPLVYDWLDDKENGASWCAYQYAGFPFFMLMPRWRVTIAASLNDPDNLGVFRNYEKFREQWTAAAPIPSVVFIEPKYTDDKVHASAPNDDHSPTGIAKGQEFLAEIYNTLVSNPTLWATTMMIVTYDEHGGFFDHVPPLQIPTNAGTKHFPTTGPRVPAFVVSPYVTPGSIFSGPLDHTSILQLFADRFTNGKAYSDAVAARQKYLTPLKSILLDRPSGRPIPRIPQRTHDDLNIAVASAPAGIGEHGAPSATATAQAFHGVAIALAEERPDLLVQPRWIAVAQYVANPVQAKTAIV